MPSGLSADAFAWLAAACREWLRGRAGRTLAPASFPSTNPDPAVLARMAYVHGVEGLLHVLAAGGLDPVSSAPAALKERWEAAYYSTRIENAEAMTVIGELLDAARAIGTPLIILKGPAAVASVYGDIGLRPMSDLDVLCRECDLPALAAAARALGFVSGPPYLQHLGFSRAGSRWDVELHFTAYFEMTAKEQFLEGAWTSATTATIEEWSFPVMSAERQVVFDVGHCLNDALDVTLKHLVDLAGRLLLHAPHLDRRVLEQLLLETGLKETFGQLAVAIDVLFGVPVEVEGGPTTEEGARRMLARSAEIGSVRERRAVTLVLRQPGLRRKAEATWLRLFPSTAVVQATYGLRSPAAARAWMPIHAARTALDTIARLAAGK